MLTLIFIIRLYMMKKKEEGRCKSVKLVWISSVELLNRILSFYKGFFKKNNFLSTKEQTWKPQQRRTNSELIWELQSSVGFKNLSPAWIWQPEWHWALGWLWVDLGPWLLCLQESGLLSPCSQLQEPIRKPLSYGKDFFQYQGAFESDPIIKYCSDDHQKT